MNEKKGDLLTFAPHPSLAPYIHSYWALESRFPFCGEVRYLHPDGGHGITLNLGDSVDPCGPFPKGASVSRRLLSPRELRLRGRIRVAGIRLRPEGAFSLFRTAALAEDSFRPGELEELIERAAGVASPDELRRLFDSLLLERGAAARPTPAVVEAVHRIRETSGTVHIESLARGLEMTPRHLERLFRERVGYSPKQLARITRARRAKMALASDSGSLAEIAGRFGYADQAHFTRDFSQIIGIPPGEYLERRAEIDRRQHQGRES